MPSRRIERLNEQLRREISEIVRWDVKDPRVGPTSVSQVRTSGDLSHAKVWVLITGDQDDRRETLAGLEKAAPYIRSALTDRLEIRKVPELHFQADESLERAARIEALLDETRPANADAEADANADAEADAEADATADAEPGDAE